jgi:hypothetical protein
MESCPSTTFSCSAILTRPSPEVFIFSSTLKPDPESRTVWHFDAELRYASDPILQGFL